MDSFATDHLNKMRTRHGTSPGQESQPNIRRRLQPCFRLAPEIEKVSRLVAVGLHVPSKVKGYLTSYAVKLQHALCENGVYPSFLHHSALDPERKEYVA